MSEPSIAPVTADPPTDHSDRSVDRSLVHGIAWTAVVKVFVQIVRWGSTLVIARLLTPHDYGLVGMALVYTGLVRLVNEFGISAAIIQKRNLTSDQLARIGGFSALLGLGFASLSVAAAGAVALFFDAPEVRLIIIVLSANFVLRGIQMLPKALLSRDLRYRQLAWIDGAEAIALAGGTLALAIAGFGYWALVLGSVLAPLVGLVTAEIIRPHRITLPRPLHTIADAISFGWEVVAARLAWYTYSNADFAVVGRMLGDAALGAYTFGWTLASLPVERVSALVDRVTPGVFSRVQTDPTALRRYLLALTEGLAIVTFPIAAGFALTAREFVVVVLGPQWTPAIVPLTLLSAYAGFRSITTLYPKILVATGHTRTNMRFNFVAALVLPAAFVIGARWGTAGVATAWILVYPFVVVPLHMRFAFRLVGVRWGVYARSLRPAIVSTMVMGIAVLGVRAMMPLSWPPLAALFAFATTGAGVYITIVLVAYRDRIARFRTFVRTGGTA